MKTIDIDKKMEHFYKVCQENKLSITPQRVAIFKEIVKSNEHPSTDIVYKNVRKELPNVSFDTVNRTLLTFSEIGLLDVVEGYGNPKRFDADTLPHHHFWCVKCNKIVDIYEDEMNIEIPENIINPKFKLIKTKMVFEGICDDCQ